MDERRLAELLRLVDDAVDEPGGDAHDFKRRLRAELDETLYHGASSRPSAAIVAVRPTEAPTPRQRSGRWLAAAAAVAVVVGAVAVAGTRNAPSDPTASLPPSTAGVPTSAPVTTLPVLVGAAAACERYADAAEPIEVLSAFAVDSAGRPPDLVGTEAALRQLALDAAAGGSLDTVLAGALERAAGALGEAGRELEAGDRGSAAAATQYAVLQLRDHVVGVITAGCFP